MLLERTALRKILAVRLDNIGDIVMLTPALRTLRRTWPDAHITLMVSPAGNQVTPMLPWVDEVIVWRAVWQDASNAMPLEPAREVELIDDLRAREFDAAFIFTSFSQSPYPPAYACYLAGIPVRLGQSKEFGGSVLSEWVKPRPDEMHQVDRNLHLLEAAGLSSAGRELELHVPVEVQTRADQILSARGLGHDAPFIVLAPGASAAARRYDPARFAVAARMLIAETRLPIVVIGSAKEQALAAPILAAHRELILSLVGQTSVVELAGVIRRASLVICNDSGPMHIADAFQCPQVVMYAGTEYESQWRPRNSPAKLLRCPTDCSPCYRFTCPYQMECLDIPPSELVTAALEMLENENFNLAHSR